MANRKSSVSLLLKYFLFIENLLLWVVGTALTATGTYILFGKSMIVNGAVDFVFDPSCVMCLGGSIIVFVTFFGCMGALRENTCFLKLHNTVLGLIFLAEMTVVVLIVVFYYVPNARKKLNLFPEDAMRDAMKMYGFVDDGDIQNLINNMQKTLKCCGWSNDDEGYKDWDVNDYFSCNNSNPSPERCSVPASCCRLEQGEHINILCGHGSREIDENGLIIDGDLSKIHTRGCLKAVGAWIDNNARIVGGALLGILLLQIFLLYLNNTLSNQIKTQRTKWKKKLVQPSVPPLHNFRDQPYI